MNDLEKRLTTVEGEVETIKKQLTQIEFQNKITTHAGFIDIYFDNLHKHSNCKKCYEAVEDMYHDIKKDFKYSSYESFKVYLSNHRKR